MKEMQNDPTKQIKWVTHKLVLENMLQYWIKYSPLPEKKFLHEKCMKVSIYTHLYMHRYVCSVCIQMFLYLNSGTNFQ